MKTNDLIKEWEKEFDEKFVDADNTIHLGGSRITDIRNHIKTLLTTILENDIEELAKKVYIHRQLEEMLENDLHELDKKVYIHRQLEEEFVGSINDLLHKRKSNNPHTSKLEILEELLKEKEETLRLLN